MGRHSPNSGSRAFAAGGGRPTSGRSAESRRWLWVIAALLLVVALTAAFLVWRGTAANSAGCDGERSQVSVAADPAMVGPIRDAAQRASADSCFDYEVSDAPGAQVPGLLTQGASAPDLWVADSQLQARRVTTQVRRDLDMVSESVASSPTVVAGNAVADAELPNWVAVMRLPDLRAGSPVNTSTGDAPIVGALAQVEAGSLEQEQFTEAMTVLAVQQNNARPENDDEQSRLGLAYTSEVPVVTSEQQFLIFQRGTPESTMTARVPDDGTVMLDYPLVNTAAAARTEVARDAGEKLAGELESDEGIAALNGAGFRAPDGSVGELADGNIGDDVAVLVFDDPARVDQALRQWQVLGVPIRSLVVQDTSGSMAFTAGDSTRAELLIEASDQGLGLFPNNAMIGGWAFSVDRDGSGQDWEELSPIRRLDAQSAGGGTHRDELRRAVQSGLAPDALGGGTGLYDTTLAAFQRVQDTYDPQYSNSVIIMTDGTNDDPVSISLNELLSTLRSLEDPARPVLVLTIGISEDADADALRQIAEATGGTTYTANNAADIRSVFVNAIQARVAQAG